MAEDQKPFHIIVAGGGLVGLSAAHIFQSLAATLSASSSRPVVRFTVLEAHPSVTPYIGSLLLFYPSTFRVYDQLGLLSALRPLVDETNFYVNFRAEDGSVLCRETGLADMAERRHGHGFRVVHRPVFVECLYENLSQESKSSVLLGKRVVGAQVDDEGVKVTCQDGTVVEGDILIGADGVRSRVRSAMQQLKAKAEEDPEAAAEEAERAKNDKSPYLASFRMLFGNAPIPPGLPNETNFEGAHPGISTQILTGTKQAWWAVYEQLETPTRDRARYTEDDKQKLVEKWGHLHMTPGYTLNDIISKHNRGPLGLINLEEGLVDTWTWDRIVLVGDAVRKVEPHAGLGFNQGLTDIVTIANKLHGLLKSSGPAPSADDLRRIFEEYQGERLEVMPTIDRVCRRRARQVAWPHWGFRVYATWVLPYVPLARLGLKYVMGPVIKKTPVLEWLEEQNLPAHEIEYEHQGLQDSKLSTQAVVGKGEHKYGLPLVTAAGLLAGLAVVGWRYYPRI
ncbi:hypothetical protein BKA67DRAFT_78007 [Truncatella angustata]|uniref:FAD-binding domain-containing protein n=1 Tax=Truncatella angustata TaxID=152316 RepID=A0A9P9A5U3_9PEZI|nr:uncharacterized protein BKA67DRAFT_78007 [Truncatella angustata]KAH6661189.1 hypothetical protein BKA67DRAFT_78007 [Truncatella angustata]KAH8199863.1 hypothetical protein TruAng_005979 [Truncatella angustata]